MDSGRNFKATGWLSLRSWRDRPRPCRRGPPDRARGSGRPGSVPAAKRPSPPEVLSRLPGEGSNPSGGGDMVVPGSISCRPNSSRQRGQRPPSAPPAGRLPPHRSHCRGSIPVMFSRSERRAGSGSLRRSLPAWKRFRQSRRAIFPVLLAHSVNRNSQRAGGDPELRGQSFVARAGGVEVQKDGHLIELPRFADCSKFRPESGASLVRAGRAPSGARTGFRGSLTRRRARTSLPPPLHRWRRSLLKHCNNSSSCSL